MNNRNRNNYLTWAVDIIKKIKKGEISSINDFNNPKLGITFQLTGQTKDLYSCPVSEAIIQLYFLDTTTMQIILILDDKEFTGIYTVRKPDMEWLRDTLWDTYLADF